MLSNKTFNINLGSLNVVTLLLSGRATPYLHNGVVYVGDEDHYVRNVYFYLYI